MDERRLGRELILFLFLFQGLLSTGPKVEFFLKLLKPLGTGVNREVEEISILFVLL